MVMDDVMYTIDKRYVPAMTFVYSSKVSLIGTYVCCPLSPFGVVDAV